MDLMELRHLADYKPQSVAAREAKRAYDRAEKFLSAIERALGETASAEQLDNLNNLPEEPALL